MLLQINPLIPHIAVGIPVFFLVHFLLRKKSSKIQNIFLIAAWAVGVVLLALNKVLHYARGEHILAQLPLHLCYISLIFFIPMSLFVRKKYYRDFIFYVNAIGALMALLCPAKDYISGGLSAITLTYVAFHFIIIYIPFWLYFWGQYSPKITFRRALEIIGVLFVLSLAVHGLNLLLVKNGVDKANYFWTLTENGIYNVGILSLFASVIPYDYTYLFAFAAPMLALYIGLWSIGLRVVERRKVKNM